MIYVYLADGFEEIEAIAPVDILRRCGMEVKTVGVTGKTVTGAHGICVEADILPETVDLNAAQMLILPGGMPGTTNLEKDSRVTDAVAKANAQGKYIAAICAAPSVFGHMGLLEGKHATCYPGFEAELHGAIVSEDGVVCDGNIITAKGAGCASDFGFLLAGLLADGKDVLKIRKAMQYADSEEA